MSVFFFGGQWRARASDIIGTPVRAYIVLVVGGPSLAFSDECAWRVPGIYLNASERCVELQPDEGINRHDYDAGSKQG
jgi:hypothetical protein